MKLNMERAEIIENNKTYWNDHADLWFGTTALPVYGVRFPTEDDLHLFGDVLIMYIPSTALAGQPIYREHLIRLPLT